jgi:AcrR family transcriptional regulator
MNRESPGRTPAFDSGRPSGNREKILATALRLFTLQGVDATPTAQISREAKVSTGTLFHYFPDKSSLVDQVYLSIKKELVGMVRSSDDATYPTQERIERFLRGYIAWGVANPEKVRFLDQFYNSPSLGDEVKRQVQDECAWMLELSAAAVREGILPDLPLEFHAVMISRIINGILTLIESQNTGMSQEEIIEHGLAMLWRQRLPAPSP